MGTAAARLQTAMTRRPTPATAAQPPATWPSQTWPRSPRRAQRRRPGLPLQVRGLLVTHRGSAVTPQGAFRPPCAASAIALAAAERAAPPICSAAEAVGACAARQWPADTAHFEQRRQSGRSAPGWPGRRDSAALELAGGLAAEDGRSDGFAAAGTSYEDLCRAHTDAFIAEAAAAEVQSALAVRVAGWRGRIGPLLAAQDARGEFDIHACAATPGCMLRGPVLMFAGGSCACLPWQ